MSQQNKRWMIIMPVFLALMFVAGMFLGNKLQNSDSNFVMLPQTDKLNTILDYIAEEYVDPVDKNSLIEETIPMLLENLDPHSIYIPAEEFAKMNEPLVGNFDGIGVQFNIQNDTVMVVNVISGGPSERVGLLAGDRIVYIDDTLFVGPKISSDDVMKKLRGQKGTVVKVGLSRKGEKEIITKEIVRGEIPLYSVDVAYMIDKETGYIKLSKFSRTTYTEFLGAVQKLNSQGMESLVFDLRGNGGGYMDAAINIADEFLEPDKLIVYTEGRAHPKISNFASAKNLCVETNVVVLIDEWSASASEILAGALQDNDRALIVGRRSFGKGLVQEPTVFTDGSSLRLTIARYHTPTGRCIQRPYDKGVEDYYHKFGQRVFESNEADTSLQDTLKYYTPKGKVVYGGGGILPDLVVPHDTAGISPLYSNLVNGGLIYKYAFEYVDTHRTELSALKDVYELKRKLIRDDVLSMFMSYAEKQGVTVSSTDFNTSKQLIRVQLHAYIARNIFDNDGYFPVIKELDNTLIKGVELLKTTR